MKCILHIGTEKTGTTLIQDWLYANQSQLGSQGVYLSDNLGKTNNRLIPAYFHSNLDDWAKEQRISSIDEKKRYFLGFLDRLSSEISMASKTHEYFVITSEHLHSRVTQPKDIKALSRYLKAHFSNVQIVCYFRNQFDVFVSLYSTALKISSSDRLEEYMKSATPSNYYYNYLAIADRWSSEFGIENCNFGVYDRYRFKDRDLRKDFLTKINSKIDFKVLDYTIDSANKSLYALQGAAYRVINKHISYWDEMNGGINPLNIKVKRALSSVNDLKIGKIKSYDRQHIEEIFAECNDEFFKRYIKTENQFKSVEQKTDEELMLPLNHVSTIIESILDEILPLINNSTPLLMDKEVDCLRDIALKIEGENKLTVDDALLLMRLAQKVRPNGPYIKKKIKE